MHKEKEIRPLPFPPGQAHLADLAPPHQVLPSPVPQAHPTAPAVAAAPSRRQRRERIRAPRLSPPPDPPLADAPNTVRLTPLRPPDTSRPAVVSAKAFSIRYILHADALEPKATYDAFPRRLPPRYLVVVSIDAGRLCAPVHSMGLLVPPRMRIYLPWDFDVYATAGRPRPSEAEEIPSYMLQEILMKLPTKDVARCCCVSRHWRSAVRDPTFRKLHAASPAALSAEPEFLRLSGVPCGLGQIVKASVFRLSSDKPMCTVAIPERYFLHNICNGLVCFLDRDRKGQTPVLVCNPVTGETLALPEAPPLSNMDNAYHLFALGFSPPTNEHKLFRLSFPSYSYSFEERVEVGVYTLGDARGWRKHSFLSPFSPSSRRNNTSAPVLIDGKLHMITRPWNRVHTYRPTGVLVVDVRAETCRTYPLPNGLGTFPDENPVTFELKGQLCFAAHVRGRSTVLRFWVMAMENKELDGKKEPHWDLRYSFCVKGEHRFTTRNPWNAWFEHETLWYTRYDTLHMYPKRSSVPDHGRLLQRCKQLQRIAPREWEWSIHRGYRPTLLSPRIFELPPPQDEIMMDVCS
ncbi:unnamed protein product [Triticum turgidum subsp. durum]|uniref:F-box domain-containing protein n=1 Tax=Triticum turgidum subsp. durum TaxID=4567 RepID=A0A9R1NLW8_TRITD|nr:unnamed protein product [Triticum turgidum subsp. durum]